VKKQVHLGKDARSSDVLHFICFGFLNTTLFYNFILPVKKYLAINRGAGADPGFKVRGGALKKIAPSGGRRGNFWGISCEKSRFYAKKSYF
jgi:hypothetical protein